MQFIFFFIVVVCRQFTFGSTHTHTENTVSRSSVVESVLLDAGVHSLTHSDTLCYCVVVVDAAAAFILIIISTSFVCVCI